ncbi:MULTISPECIES: ABC transporter substrate-binding protein [Pseudanabaena]|uniref:ABC-type transporter, periplasmic subunit n=2 Tax=Pseudanabaena TaxID=1152 RepID=L8N6T8_9CYAN|nr:MULTISPECIES: ABC transporter substrate-binding protein [Pseudanabaena]ELS34425.1 ABC-type transporter, periplasmic subunit [Pseudanabaena biceps PCC 7429]MDG3493386.1 ABC transporter substrate-binding protein [Pseudanabaena catenata USMAC16]
MRYLLRRLFTWVAIALITVTSLFACTNGKIINNRNRLGISDRTDERIVIGTTSKIRTLDPADANEFFISNIFYNTLERLYTYKEGSNEIVPQLAADMPKVSDDGLIYTVPVKTGIKFHDRTNFNAYTMKFALERFMNSKGTPAYILGDIIEAISAPNETELIFKLKEPLQFFPKFLAFTGAAAISPQVYKHIKDEKTGKLLFLPDKLVGTGPYQVTQFVEGSYLRLDAFPDYWGKKPVNRGIDIQFFSSNANLLNAFKTGAVDIAFQTLTPTQVKNIEANAKANGWTIASGQGATILYMVLNTQQSPLNDVRVRQALAAAIDRPLLESRIFFNQRSPLYSLIPSAFGESKPVFEQKYGDNNGKLARQLLETAGYSNEKPAQITIWYSPKYGGNGDLIASTLRASIQKNVGKIIQIKTERVENTVGYAFLDKGVYPAYLLDWVPDILDPDNYIKPFLECEEAEGDRCKKGGSQFQGSFYNNPLINDLIAKERKERDSVKRSQLLQKIQEILAQDVPFIPLWQNKEYAFAQKGVDGVKIEPNQQLPYWNISKQ